MKTLKEAAHSAGWNLNEPLDWAEVVTSLTSPTAPGGPYSALELEPGDYSCRSAMKLSSPTGRPIRLVGQAPVNQHAATGRGAAFVWHKAPPNGGSLAEILAPDCEIERVAFRGRGAAMDPVANGLIARARVHLRQVWVTSVNIKPDGAAIVIDGSDTIAKVTDPLTGRTTGGGPGANSWDMYDVAVRGVWGGGHGVWIRGGGDSNAGCGTLVNASDVQAGVGIWDDSFLGNMWLACHVHQGANNTSPPYKCIDPNARSAFIRCYTEGLVQNDIRRPSMWIQGQGRVGGGASIVSEGRMHNMTVYNPTIQSVRDPKTGISTLMRWYIDADANEVVDDSWILTYDPRVGAHQKWLRVLNGGASSKEVLAMREGGLRTDGVSPLDSRVASLEARIKELEERLGQT